MSKSRKYRIDGKQYVFTFDGNNKLNGISTGAGRAGQWRGTPIDPTSNEFSTIKDSDEALAAYNINKYKKNIERSITQGEKMVSEAINSCEVKVKEINKLEYKIRLLERKNYWREKYHGSKSINDKR